MTIRLPKKLEQPASRAEDYILLVYGPPKVGKTTFASQFDRPLFISTDRGTRFIRRFCVEVSSWKDYLLMLKALEKEGVDRYGCFVIDHVDDLFNMCQAYVCKKLGIEHPSDEEWGKGWNALRLTFTNGIQRLLRFGHGLIFIAHEDIKTIRTKTSELDRTMPSMTKTARKIVLPITDAILYAGFEVIKKKGKEVIQRRILIAEPHEELEAGDRTGRCLPSMELNGRKFLKHFTQGVASHGEEKEGSRKKGKRGRRARA